MDQQCIVCGQTKLTSVLEINNSSSSVAKLLDGNLIHNDKKIPISLVICDNCKLCQLKNSNFVGDDFYEEYLMNVFFSQQSREYQKWLASDFVNFFNLSGKLAFEIGCGDGEFANFLRFNGLNTIGIEPSKSFYEIAKQRIKVFNQFFDENSSLEKNFYDAFVSKEVFEHLKNPNQILKSAKLFLKPDGIGMIAVPSFLSTIKNNRYYDIFRDHIAYYTKYSLQYLLSLHNFEIVKIFHSSNQEYLISYFRNNDYFQDNVKLFSGNFNNYKKSVIDFFNNYKDKKIALWGAGGRGIEFLSMFNITPDDIIFVIDSNPNKWHKYTPSSHLLIKNPVEINFNEIDIILISAVLFQDEIIKDLKDKYKYKNKVGTIVPVPHLINI